MNFPQIDSFRLNSFRLWTVQLFAIIKEYEDQFTIEPDTDLCMMIEYKVNKTQQTLLSTVSDESVTCEPVGCKKINNLADVNLFCLFVESRRWNVR
jgi:hypothetical protein